MQKQTNLSEVKSEKMTMEAMAEKPQKLLYPASKIKVVHVEFDEKIQKTLAFARRCGTLRCGLESIESFLRIEEAGFKEGNRANHVAISRLLIMTNDGSDRFYRHCESLLSKYSHRMMGIKLNTTSTVVGDSFFGKDKSVKAILVVRKEFVFHVFSTVCGLS